MNTYTLDDLIYLMRRLREPEHGCPWDLKQTYKTIVPSTLEEAYEVAAAIESEDYEHLPEELGDLLFQVIFYAQLGAEEHCDHRRFDFAQIVSGLVEKLVRRHPHVFPGGDLKKVIAVKAGRNAQDELAIKQRWESLKREERLARGESSILADIPLNFPALSRAQKLQKRAAHSGFDWPDIEQPLAKIEEELAEVRVALAEGNQQAVAEELGDLLFSVVNACRHAKVDAESSLRFCNKKFERRFAYIERQLKAQKLTLAEASLVQMEALWCEAKANE